MGNIGENVTQLIFGDELDEPIDGKINPNHGNYSHKDDSQGPLIGGILTALLAMCIAVTLAILYIHYKKRKPKDRPPSNDTVEIPEDNWPSQDMYENVGQNNNAYIHSETGSSQGSSSIPPDPKDDNLDDNDEEIDDPIYSVPNRTDSIIEPSVKTKSHLKTFKGSDLEEEGANMKGHSNGVIHHYYDTGTDSHSDVTSWDTDGYDSENIYDDIQYETTTDGQLLYDIVESSPPDDDCPLYSEVPPEIHKELQSILDLECDKNEDRVANGDIKSKDEAQNDENTLKETRRAKVKPPLKPKPVIKPKPKPALKPKPILQVNNTSPSNTTSHSPNKKYRGKKPPLKPKPKLPLRRYHPSEVPNGVTAQNLERNDTCNIRLSNDSTIMVENELYHSANHN